MINFWKLSYETVKEQRDTLTNDIEVLKANIGRLEQIRDIKDSALKGADIKIKTLEQENEKLKEEIRQLKGED